jgi:hypothetical protein
MRENGRTSIDSRSVFFPQRGKHADGVPFFTGSADLIWESALQFSCKGKFPDYNGEKIGPQNFPYVEVKEEILRTNIKIGK